jgi:hypothetical protein
MADLREALRERVSSIEPDSSGFERVIDRRRRRDVRRKVGVYAMILLIASIAAAGAFGLQHQRRSVPMITPDNVGTLHPVWTAHVSGSPSTPAIADGMVYVSADRLYAFRLSCATTSGSCEPAWTADVGTTPAEQPVVSDGVVLVTSISGLFAFDTACTDPICEPIWTAPSPSGKGLSNLNSHEPTPYPQFSVPAVADDTIYAAGGEGLYAFPLRCRDDGGVCSPSWIGSGLGSYQSPVVGVDVIYVPTDAGLDVYRMTCPARRCHPLRQFGQNRVGGDPVVTTVGNDVYINEARVAGLHDPRSAKVAWIGEIDRPGAKTLNEWVGHAAVADGVAYMAASRIYAFPIDCRTSGRRCRPMWVGPRQVDDEIQRYRSWSDPVVSDGLVFASTDRPYAFKGDCATDGEECQPVWVGPAGFASQPAVSDTAVAVTYVDGRVVLFEASGS